MHIVYLVANIADISGGTRVIVEHVNGLFKRGHKAEIWTTSAKSKPYFECLASIKQANNSQLNKPDILVMADPVLLPLVSERRKKTKTFLLLQHDYEWVGEVMGVDTSGKFIRQFKDYFLDGQCTIITVSKWLQDVMQAKYGLHSMLVPNGIDLQLFHKAEPLIAAQEPSILLVYDPQVWKGYQDAAEAIIEVQRRIPQLKIMIIGKFFPETPKIAGTHYGYPFPVIYFNRPEQTDLAKIYASASAFIAAPWREGFGLPGLEALTCGTPLVTTDAGGVREYALPDKTAVVVQPNNPQALAAGIIYILENKGLQTKLIRNGLKKAQEFDWKHSIAKLESLFSV